MNNQHEANSPIDETENTVVSDDKLINPVERGLVGKFFYHVGALATRLALDIRFEGRENLPDGDEAYVIACNHETYVDGLWIMMALDSQQRRRFCSIAAQDLLTDYGAFGRIMMKVGRGVPLNRKGHPLRGLMQSIRQVENGNILLVHPEGTRSRNGKLAVMQDGGAFIGKKAKCLIIPAFIDGGYEIYNRYYTWPDWWNKEMKRRRQLIIRFGEPISPSHYRRTRDITAALSDWMTEQYANKKVPRILEELPPLKMPAGRQRDRRDAHERAKISTDAASSRYSDVPDPDLDAEDAQTES